MTDDKKKDDKDVKRIDDDQLSVVAAGVIRNISPRSRQVVIDTTHFGQATATEYII